MPLIGRSRSWRRPAIASSVATNPIKRHFRRNARVITAPARSTTQTAWTWSSTTAFTRTPGPTPFEDGVSCALRHHVPLVVAGTTALNPFDDWTTVTAGDDDIVEACERAGSAAR